MIKPGEIQQKAREAGVRDQQIEKDYVLSWILQSVAQHEQLSKTIIFKGGTVLKKIYFDDYRFSEDLDFTLLNNDASPLRQTQGGAGSAQATNEQIFAWFKETFEYVLEEANIRLEILDNNEHEDGGINFYISYIGPLGGQGNNKKVKVDISRSEKLEFKPVMQTVILSYSDLTEHQILCYPLEEVLVEKMRTVMQRMQARDFYDIWYLLEQHGMDVNFYIKEFANKCESKKLNPADFQKKLAERLPAYKGRWQSSMMEQIQNLPDFDQVEREVMRHLKKLKL
ncbi:MAG TPA: nucleotidyl transferase AbiEii/AbiGii toxin family protein [Bacteroidia bacterium]|nr:nucleotidyl transferase AbiEii/AbiGii toxin family protein [Bacteroidia bacterium]